MTTRNTISGQNVPPSPCPNFFRYSIDGQDIVGLLKIPSPELGKTLKINLELSVRTRLPSSYVGVIELATTRAAALQKMMRNQPIQYKVRFPTQIPLPRVKTIITNGQVICVGRVAQGPVITTIRLEHILYTQGAKRQQQLALKFQPDDNLIDDDYDYDYNYIETNAQINPNQKYNQPLHTELKWNQPLISDQNWNQPSITDPNPPQRHRDDGRFKTHPTNAPQLESKMNLLSQSRDEDICGMAESADGLPLIAGGTHVERGTWPWLAAVYTTDSTTLSYKCAGSLVSKRIVVTAAHCVYTGSRMFNAHEVVVSLGRQNIRKWQLDDGAVMREAIIVTYHPDFMRQNTQSYDADIAVIVLRTEVEYNKFIRPICLWRGTKDIQSIEGKLGRVVGWGKDPESNQILTSEPKEIDIPIVSQENCFSSHPVIQRIASNRTFCAGRRDDTGPCNGDSGGALAIKVNNQWTLRGIVSVAIPQANNICNLKHYVVFTDVAKFLDWILMYVNI